MRRRPERPPRSAPGGPRPVEAEGFLVGRHSVLEALESGVPLERILIADDAGASAWFAREGSDSARRRGVPVARVPRVTLDRLAPGVAHQGIAARVTEATFRDPEDLLREAPAPALVVLAEGVEDPRNLGAIVRSAAGAGAAGLLVPERRSAPLGPSAAKASAGTLARLPVARVKNAARGLELLAEHGIWTVGLEAGAPPIWDADLARPTCLVVGGEGTGLSRLVRERCDVLAGIPIASGVESLNVSVAAGIALFEARRQRR